MLSVELLHGAVVQLDMLPCRPTCFLRCSTVCDLYPVSFLPRDSLHAIAVYVTVSVTRTSMKLKKLNYWKGNYAEVSARLEEIDWEMEMCQHTVEEKWIFFRNIVLKLANELVPEKREFKKKKNH